jgi:hypothetical protein
MVSSTIGTGTIELLVKFHRGSLETGDLFLVLNRLQVQVC